MQRRNLTNFDIGKETTVLRTIRVLGLCGVLIAAAAPATNPAGNTATPADGHTVHVTPRTWWRGR